MRRMKDKIEGTITNADSALAVENLSASVDVASSGKSADITLSSLTKAKAKLNVAVTGVATMGKKGTTSLTIDVPNQNDLLNALTNDDIDAITGGMVDDDGNPIKPNEVIVDASLTVSGRAADAKVTGDKIKEAKAAADSASSGVKSVREELDQLKLDSVAVDKTLMKEGSAADAKTVGEKLNIKADVVTPHTFTIPITGQKTDDTIPGYSNYIDISIASMTSNDIVNVTVYPVSTSVAVKAQFTNTESFNGYLRLRAKSVPSEKISAQWYIVR